MSKLLIKKVCNNIQNLEEKLKKYDNEFTYSAQTFEIESKYNEDTMNLLKEELSKWNEVLDILLNDK